MKKIINKNGTHGLTAALLLLVSFADTQSANGQVDGFVEDFTGPLDTNVWTQGGELDSHLGITDGSYFITDKFGAPGTKLTRFTGGGPGSYRNEVEILLDPFRLDANPGTGSDVKWKMFGPDGFMEIVLNSFGNMRLFHNDADGGGGNIQPQTNIGVADGDRLKLIFDYDVDTDEIEVTYSLNGGEPVPFYSGGGIDGPIGDIITNFVEVEVFKFNEENAETAVAGIDYWNLGDVVIPPGPTPPFRVTVIDYDPVADTFRFTWDSEPDKTYGIYWTFDLSNWDSDIADGVVSQGASTTYPAPEDPAEPNPGTIDGVRPEAIFFRVEEIEQP